MATEKKPPLRMCLACRQMKDKRELIRVVKGPDNDFSIDSTGKKNGRGAYLCNNSECVNRCMKNRLLNKNFKCEIPSEVYEKLSEEYIGDK
ncbi:MAG: YlxR family protein [Clostridia bacterium]|nr:YlxR family protein [Clostridia bacterium]